MKSAELRKLNPESLRKKIKETEEKHFSSLCTFSMGTSSDTSILKKNRKLIARVRTILNEKLKQEGGTKN
jgi:ribosomal protein L29